MKFTEKENINLILLNAGYAEHRADWNWKGISSPFARLYLVQEGSAKLHLPDGVYHLKPDNLYLIPAFTIHSYECDDYFALYYIHIYEEQIGLVSILEQLHFPVEIEASKFDETLIKRLLEINPDRELRRYDPNSYDNSSTLLQNIAFSAQKPFFMEVETRGILLQLFSRFLEKASPKSSLNDDRVLRSLEYIRKNIDQKINVQTLSEISFLSEDHLIRLFKKELNTTPLQYINEKKIEKAQLMLIITSMSIKDISYTLSFENHSYFNRVFKKITGQTPSQYRNYKVHPSDGE